MNGKRPGGWVAMAWRWWRDPKVLAVSLEAEALWNHGLALSGEHEGDGNVQREALKVLHTKGRRAPLSLARELVDVGLWHETPTGFAVPFATWDKWQTTAAQNAEKRARDAEKKARQRGSCPGGTPRGTGRGSPSASGEGEGEGEGHSPTSPFPPPGSLIGNQTEPGEPWQDQAGLWWTGPRPEGEGPR